MADLWDVARVVRWADLSVFLLAVLTVGEWVDLMADLWDVYSAEWWAESARWKAGSLEIRLAAKMVGNLDG